METLLRTEGVQHALQVVERALAEALAILDEQGPADGELVTKTKRNPDRATLRVGV